MTRPELQTGKRLTCVLALALAGLCCTCLDAAPGRVTMALDGQWQIEEGKSREDIPVSFNHTVPVPGMANLAQPAVRFPIFGINDNMLVVVWGLGVLWGGYGEAPMRLRRDCRPIRGNGSGGWRWVRGHRLAYWGSQPGLERSTESAATGKGARPRRSLATDPDLRSGSEFGRIWACQLPAGFGTLKHGSNERAR